MPTSSSTTRISRPCAARASLARSPNACGFAAGFAMVPVPCGGIDAVIGVPLRCSGRLERAEVQRDARAARRDVLERHASRVLVDDLLHDGKSQPGPFRFGRDVRLEWMREHVLGESRDAIAKREYR